MVLSARARSPLFAFDETRSVIKSIRGNLFQQQLSIHKEQTHRFYNSDHLKSFNSLFKLLDYLKPKPALPFLNKRVDWITLIHPSTRVQLKTRDSLVINLQTIENQQDPLHEAKQVYIGGLRSLDRILISNSQMGLVRAFQRGTILLYSSKGQQINEPSK